MPEKPKRETAVTVKDIAGYALGDTGCQLTFGLVGGFLSMFYTDVLGISLKQIAVLLFAARIWDAANDPLWGTITDRRRPGKFGKFRGDLLWWALPQSAAALLMFTAPPFGPAGTLAWAYVTYIAYGMIYTIVNISYGSMAGLVSPHAQDRSRLSIFRTVGAGAGSLPAAILLPQLVFSVNGTGIKHLDGGKLRNAVAILGICAVGALLASFLMSKERVAVPADARRPALRKTIPALLQNRPFLTLCAASALLIALQLYTQTVNGYLFKDYFNRPGLFGLYAVFTYAPMGLLVPALPYLVRRFGKKEVSAAGLLLTAAAYFAAFALRTQNPYVYLGLCFASGLGGTCFVMEVWALITDVIDYQETLSGQREEGTVYAFVNFARKLGHTAAGSGGALLLKAVGYETSAGGVAQTRAVAAGVYRMATLPPALAALAMSALLAFAYSTKKARAR
ncbi:MAG: glycoside-pentoside-hexuronide (GPH):cation symporter [Oscillospiraceae bacterium]|nr:glycoside-pentoside-hexuronide (GPH):cation symporter [Oscillospiraceae bacterium]